MLSVTRIQSWYPFPFFLDREKTLGDDEVIRKIIKKTIPNEKKCKLLDVDHGDGKLLLEAVKRNSLLQGVGLVRRREDIQALWKEQKGDRITIKVSEISDFRAQPEYDLIFLFECLAYYPKSRRMEMLQYCKMLLKPGGRIVTAAAKNCAEPTLRPAAIQKLLQRSGFYKVSNMRLTASLRLLTAERINKHL